MRALVAMLAVLAPLAGGAEECTPRGTGYPGSAARERARADGIASVSSSSLTLRRPSDDAVLRGCPAGVRAAPAEVRLHVLGGYPDDRGDGSLWSGRGASTRVTAGVIASAGVLTVGAIPSLAWQQNRPWRRREATDPRLSPYANPYLGETIDLPGRMGPRAFGSAGAGQSFVRVDAGPVAAGISSENLWWGPGQRDAIVLGNSAPGFPHAFVGTREAVDVRVARIEAQLVLGRLSTSRWWRADGRVAHRPFRGAALVVEPAFLRGLHLGIAQGYVGVERAGAVRSALRHAVGAGAGGTGDPENTVTSIFARWVLPASAFEVYGEYARDDSARPLELAMDPGRSAAYLLGVHKVVGAGPRRVRIALEHADTAEAPIAGAPSGTPVFYAHDAGTFYTHAGQPLGAGIGPSGEAQRFEVDALYRAASAGLFASRRLRNVRAFHDAFARPRGRDLELAAGGRAAMSRAAFDLEVEASIARRWNADFLGMLWQPSLRVAATWWPGRGRPR